MDDLTLALILTDMQELIQAGETTRAIQLGIPIASQLDPVYDRKHRRVIFHSDPWTNDLIRDTMASLLPALRQYRHD